jgi:hypothetical protein
MRAFCLPAAQGVAAFGKVVRSKERLPLAGFSRWRDIRAWRGRRCRCDDLGKLGPGEYPSRTFCLPGAVNPGEGNDGADTVRIHGG